MTQLSLFDAAAPAVRHYEAHQIDFRGVPVTIRYCPEIGPSCYREIYGHGLAHVEMAASQRIPGTVLAATGYRSLFQRPENIGDVREFCQEWLEGR